MLLTIATFHQVPQLRTGSVCISRHFICFNQRRHDSGELGRSRAHMFPCVITFSDLLHLNYVKTPEAKVAKRSKHLLVRLMCEGDWDFLDKFAKSSNGTHTGSVLAINYNFGINSPWCPPFFAIMHQLVGTNRLLIVVYVDGKESKKISVICQSDCFMQVYRLSGVAF